jgi:hypothetical protein
MAFLLAFHRHAACLAQCKLGHWASEWGKRSAQHELRIYDLIDCFYGKKCAAGAARSDIGSAAGTTHTIKTPLAPL